MEFDLLVALDEKVQIIWQHNFTGQAALPGKETRVFELLRQVAQCRVAVLVARGVFAGSHDDSSVADVVARVILCVMFTCVALTGEEIVHQFLLLWVDEVTVRDGWLFSAGHEYFFEVPLRVDRHLEVIILHFFSPLLV